MPSSSRIGPRLAEQEGLQFATEIGDQLEVAILQRLVVAGAVQLDGILARNAESGVVEHASEDGSH